MITLKKIMILGSVTSTLLVSACSSAEREHRDDTAKSKDSVVDATTKAQVSTADINMDGAEKAFMLSSYSQSLYITELATIAAKSSDMKLRTFAKEITPIYHKMMVDMETIAKGKGLLLARNTSAAQQKELDALKELSSPTLDQQVLQKLQTLQAAFTTQFNEASHFQNEALSNYAKNASAIIKQQQTKTTQLVNTANETGSQSTRPGEVALPSIKK